MVRSPDSREKGAEAPPVAQLPGTTDAPEGGGPVLELPPTDPQVIAEGHALAESVKRELAAAGLEGTLEECMAGLRGRSWSS